MLKKKVTSSLLVIAAMLAANASASAQDKTAKVGVLNDQSGLYADITG